MRKRTAPLTIALVALALVATLPDVVGCRARTTTGSVTLYARTELEPALEAIRRAIEKDYPRLSVTTVTKPFHELVEAAKQPSTLGVVIATGAEDLTPLDKAGRLEEGSGITLGEIPLVMVVAPGNPQGLRSPEDVARVGKPLGMVKKSDGGAWATSSESATQAAGLKGSVAIVAMESGRLVPAVSSGELGAALVGAHMVTPGVEAVPLPGACGQPAVRLLAARLVGTPDDAAYSTLARVLRSQNLRAELVRAVGMRDTSKPDGTGGELLLFCGAGLRLPAEDLITEFKAKTGIAVRPTFTGSGCLLAQITIGETGDLYMPGEDYYMAMAAERGYVTDQRIVAYFVPVIMVQRGNPHNIRGLRDLMKPGVRVGIGEPKACAIGDFTPKVLRANGISPEEFERNVSAHFATAPELGNAMKIQAVDAVIQWDSLASLYLDAVDVVPIPTDEKTISPVPLGTLRFSKHPEEAKRFLDFVSGPDGKAIFAKHSYTLDPAHPTFPVAKEDGS
ncbi:MAG TPA: substrate-binding domain-containing protein [Armatimonadota bacterium]|nr:substrate-binding domain-containing protein [Armatimonadota bacterium]